MIQPEKKESRFAGFIIILLIKILFGIVIIESDIVKSMYKITVNRQRENFSAKFKSNFVIELLKRE